MYSKMKGLIFILLTAFLMNGCGDLVGKKVQKRNLGSSQFEVQCELDVNKFADIMTENISSQIRCLGESLNLFIRVVKSGKPGYLSRVQLEQYIAKYRPDVKPEVIRALKSIFDIGHLITGEDPDFISKEIVDKVVNFAIVFNQEAALNFGPIFQNESPVSYALHQNHRDRISAANKSIIQSLRSIFNPERNGQIHKLNIVTLLESFSDETNREYLEKVKKVLFLKKVLIGGESEIVTHYELEKLILNFDHLLLIALDIYRYKYIILKQESILQLLKRDVNDLYDIINQGALGNRDSEVLFTMDEAIEAAKIMVDPEKFDIEKFRVMIGEVKKIALKGNATEVLGKDLKNLFDHAKSLLKTGTVFHRIYDKFKAQLESPRPVEETINFDEYRHTYPEHQEELNQFERITKKYRFMKGEFLAPYYQRGFKRNADAIFEIALYEYAIKLILSAYGSPSPNAGSVGGYSIDQFQLKRLFLRFEKELVELGLILPTLSGQIADNISLLGTLFQYQSDENKVLDVNEATEFGINLSSGIGLADDIFTFLKEKNCTFDQFNRVEPSCFRANFWKGLCTYHRTYFPLMFQSLNSPRLCSDIDNSNDYAQILKKSVQAARGCNFYTDGNKEEIFMSKGDLMSVLIVMMHAETTVLRWDKNNNNIMDPNEVDEAYTIYSPALDGFLEKQNAIIKKFKKQIYQYLIKYEQVPNEKDFASIWKFVKFLLSFNKGAPATRKTIVSVLTVIGDENKKINPDNFNCNWLRDPENIPQDGSISNKPVAGPSVVNTDLLTSLSGTVRFINQLSDTDAQSLKSEMILLSDQMAIGQISSVKKVPFINLKNLFYAILSDRSQMSSIRKAFPEGTDVERIALAVSAALADR
jgi:hypothetical protein